MRKSKGNTFVIFVILIVAWIAIYLLRILYLDSDIPNYGVLFYQQVDEGPYGYLALNELNYGCINPDYNVTSVNQYTAPHLRTNIVGNFFIWITMKIFGDTYYGYRMSSVFCMLFNYILIFLILIYINKNYCQNCKQSKLYLLLIFGCLTFDFSYFNAARIVETSIYRMLFILLVITLFFYIKKESFFKYVLLGFLVIFSVFGIYITNVFLVVSFGLFFIYRFCKGDKKKNLRCILGFSIGGGIALLLCECYMRYFWKTGIVENTLKIIDNFSGIGGYIETGTANRFTYFLDFFGNSFNLYNPILFALTLLALPIVIGYAVKKRDDYIVLVFCMYISFFLQTMYSEDYIIRKYIVITPAVIIMIYYLLTHFTDIIQSWGRVKKAIYILYITIISCFIIFVDLYRLKFIEDKSNLDFSWLDKRVIIILSLILTGAFMYLSVIYILKNKFSLRIMFITYVLMTFINIYMITEHNFRNLTFADRNIMIEMNNIDLPDKYIIGNYMISFTLYNKYVSVANYYDDMENMLLKNKNWLYFDYSTNWDPQAEIYIESIIKNPEYHLVMYREFKREKSTLGVVRNVALYKLEKIEN